MRIEFVGSSVNAVGVNVAVYTFGSPVTVKSEIVPFVTETLSAVNKNGAAENVNVTVADSPALK